MLHNYLTFDSRAKGQEYAKITVITTVTPDTNQKLSANCSLPQIKGELEGLLYDKTIVQVATFLVVFHLPTAHGQS